MKKSALFIFIFSSAWLFGQESRTISGRGNNLENPEWGMAGTELRRYTEASYSNGYNEPNGEDRPNIRDISNRVFNQTDFIGDPHQLSDFVWLFGQFLDHDISLNPDAEGEEMSIPIPAGDEFFDPDNTGTKEFRVNRGLYNHETGTEPANPRQQLNMISAFIDASGVYGSTDEVASWLRSFDRGRLKSSSGNFLPFNTTDGGVDSPIDPEAPSMATGGPVVPEKYFVAGDFRANEHPGLLCFHTLFMREHNRLADEIAQEHPEWTDEEIFQMARKINGAILQAIAYEEWLPAMGMVLPEYQGYDTEANPNILNVFSAAAFRLGHSMVNEQFIRLEDNGDTLSFGSLHLREVFFRPDVVANEGGIEPFLRGMATQPMQKLDNKVVGAMRNFLFGNPGAGGLDIVSLNILRSREKGIPDYNTVRKNFNLVPYTDFGQITTDPQDREVLENLYGDIDNLDPWVAMLSEDPYHESIAGETITTIMKKQFEALRTGDRFYYENDPAFSPEEIEEIKTTRLSDVIRRNTTIDNIQKDVFISTNPFVTVGILPFDDIRRIELEAYPNPTPRNFRVKIKSIKNCQATLNIVDQLGRPVVQRNLDLQPGENLYEMHLSEDLPTGVYLVSLVSSSGNGALRLIKQ